VVWEEVVPKELLSQKTVLIRDGNGGLQKRRMAEVLLTISDRQMAQKVAVALSESLGGKKLLALDFTSDQDFELVKRCREEVLKARAVQTRKQAKDEMVC